MTTATLSETTQELDLDSLSRMSVEQLSQLYAQGGLPEAMSALDGAPLGRMLAVRYTSATPLKFLLRRFAGTRLFPWAGKSFSAKSTWQGEGINRIRLGARMEWFRFLTRKDSSALDGKPCILLDYDLPENPWLVRQIRDELREIAPGLFLGPAMWKQEEGAALVLFFAIDTRGAQAV